MHTISASARLVASLAATLIVCHLISPVSAQNNSSTYTFTTFAGLPATGSADGVGSAALFANPYGIAIDASGNLFVADSGNKTIRKITPSGVVTTIAGRAGVTGLADGMNGSARFGDPKGVTVDGAGNLFVVDTGYPRVRKVTQVGTNWIVTTIAGVGIEGNADGTNGAAKFRLPGQIAVDVAGVLYVADQGNHTVRMITPVGTNWVTTTIAGLAGTTGNADGEGVAARFNSPYGIAVDNSTNVYVAENGNPMIRKITPTGTNWIVTTIAGQAGSSGAADGTNNMARFSDLLGLTIDNTGILYVCGGAPRTIRKIIPAGTNWVVSTWAGGPAFGSSDATGTNATFGRPACVVADYSGNVYVTDTGNSTIRQITSAAVVSTIAGSASANSANGTGPAARFNGPYGVALDVTGNLYVADTENATIRKITSAGVVSTLAGKATFFGSSDGAGSEARFKRPRGVATDAAGNIYIADTENRTIRKITPAGFVSTLAGATNAFNCQDGTNGAAHFSGPTGIAVDSAGTIYVAEPGCHTIRKVVPQGTNWVVTTIAGAGFSGTADGAGTNAQFNSPTSIAVDALTNLFIADRFNRIIRKAAFDGTNWIVSTIAGLAGAAGSSDGTNSSARFVFPVGVAVGSGSDVYVVDNNHMIRKLEQVGTNWVVSTLGGSSIFPNFGSADGVGNDARFNQPEGIASDNVGTVYVADKLNNTIRKGVFTAYRPATPVAYAAPIMNGELTVILEPPEANGQWRFSWESAWHNSGHTATGLGTGNYSIEFRSVAGYLVLPLAPVQVTSGTHTAVTNVYYPTIGMGETNSGSGSLTVFLGPTPPAGAGWRVLGETNAFFSSGFTTNLFPGIYLIEFAAVNGRVRPPSQAVQVYSEQPTVLSVNYLIPTSLPSVGTYLPSPVPANQVSDLNNYPFGFNGQLIADNRSGSGVAVETNVVLTAAHLAFSDYTLTYVSRAYWFFRRNAAGSAPQPQEARGFYILSGYAAQRSNDLGSAYLPDQSSAPSRNTDVAVLYFLQPVAGGGHGGYLPSDTVPNTWLSGTALKMLVGYPVDGSLFGDANITTNAGRMYQTEPQSYPLSLAADAVPGQQQQVYEASWFLSYPGNSGGPLYAQLNGYYYPAAVYLGTRFSGSQPVSSLVRAIDTDVVNLITLAAAQGDSGTNYTGGGVITIIPSQNINAENPGSVQFQLAPPAAVRAGAEWRRLGDTAFSSAPNYTRPVFSTNSFAVEFKSIPGWNSPSNQNVFVLPKQLSIFTAFYTVTNPVLVNRADGIGMTGTTGTVYRLERKSALTNATWLTVSTNTINSNGFNPVLTNPPPGFYRLNWLTNF